MAINDSTFKLPPNPASLQASNKLIGYSPLDTWHNVGAVLAVLQDHVAHAGESDVGEEEGWGQFLILAIVRDALRKQAEALTGEDGSNG